MFLASSTKQGGPEGFVIFGGFIALFVIFVLAQRQRRRRAFRGAAAALGATVRSMTTDQLTASARGFVFTFHLDPGGKNSPAHTYIHVKTPPFDLLLDLMKEGDRQRGKRRGAYVDVEVGDAVFDETWIVEGAPVDRIKRLLADEKLRSRLLDAARCDHAEVQVEDGDVHFSKRGLDYRGGAVVPENLELMLDLATAVMAENALAAPNASVVEGDYRSAPAESKDRSGEREQIAALKQKRAARTVESSRLMLFVVPVAIVGMTIAFFALNTRPGHGMRAVMLVEIVMVAFVVRSLGGNYFAARRTAGLGPDYPLLATLAVVVAAALAASQGLLGF